MLYIPTNLFRSDIFKLVVLVFGIFRKISNPNCSFSGSNFSQLGSSRLGLLHPKIPGNQRKGICYTKFED